MASSPEEQLATMAASLKEKTGKTLQQWTTLATKSGKARHGELVSWLKGEHAMTHGYANLVAHMTLKSDAGSRVAAGDDLVAEMFAGDKASLRPIFDKVLAAALDCGDDIEQSPKKGYLSLRRKTQFATLHPSTKTRFDLGLKLKGVVPSGRLEAAGSWNGMVSHRVRIEDAAQVDGDVVGWVRRAYEGAG